ncbi:carboxypeptidase [Aestuariibacter sp. AA17]|uniref:Carboxypeptidase n=1 Tax=Fluctibacter corallii TaxID=2984329 RepID=A0ABT3A7P8_9ALTE|nr:carboxypeptidase [Aestuariibacter sp. AA17]MCV2884341.1 carboxypeptidase [Aestuariibacter sp. AA17]
MKAKAGKLLTLAISFAAIALIFPSQAEQLREVEAKSQVVTKHKSTINGDRIEYSATAGTQPVWNEEGEAIATLFYTYYQRTDVKEGHKRPLVFSFNGGPGSASVWMHIAYTGPKILNIDEEGYPIQPYGVKSNPYSILDVADIVYVNPVNTGYSRVLKDKDGKLPDKEQQKSSFFGVNADVKYLAEWISDFVSQNNRWLSPKYLIGESYGTTRVSGLAKALQSQQWMYLNGVILVSPTDIGIKRDGIVKAANRLPYFAATAWHHKKLPESLQSKDLVDVLPEVETFTLREYLPALARGGFIAPERKREIAKRVAYYSGLTEQEVLQNNLEISDPYFWKSLLRDEGKILGRLDSRYLGIDKKEVGDSPDYWPELSSWIHAFTPAINYYLREELNYKTDVKYNIFGSVHPWDRSKNNTGENLREAMAENPFLQVLIQAGYYDGGTNYFDAKYTMWQLDQSGKMRDRVSFKGYRSGHMMYLRKPDLKASNEDVRAFILRTLPAENSPARYPR